MSIKRFKATKDNTITDAFKADLTGRGTSGSMGASDILEVFSIHAQANETSLEKSRIIIEFPVDEISTKRASAEIPKSGSVSFKLKMFNAEHSQTTPSQYWISAHPILQSWTEGSGMNMETYLDEGVSNWYTANTGDDWTTAGGTYPTPKFLNRNDGTFDTARVGPYPYEYTQYFDSGTESVDMDITEFVENWIVDHENNSAAATGSLIFTANPALNETITLYSTNGEYRMIQFSTASLLEKNTLYITRDASNSATTAAELNTQINNLISGSFTSRIDGSNTSKIHFTQSVAGIYGNTILSASVTDDKTLEYFGGGKGTKNNGLLIKLSGSFEDGTNSKSYYTKKFFSRTSQFYLKRPVIEAQIDDSKKDDRDSLSSYTSLAPTSENKNSIYFYNKIRGNLVDIPSTGSTLVVQILTSSDPGSAPIWQVNDNGSTSTYTSTRIRADRIEAGIYRAQFMHTQSAGTALRPVWSTFTSGSNPELSFLASGSVMTVPYSDIASHNESSEYVVNINNLKPSYNVNERAFFRIYTRDKNWKPNIYTVASQKAPVNTIRDGYYNIKRVADNLDVIAYSTGSTPSYSSLSYDMSGSYFELDMSILEPNYLYEISFLRKEGSEYIEQKERFKFRIAS